MRTGCWKVVGRLLAARPCPAIVRTQCRRWYCAASAAEAAPGMTQKRRVAHVLLQQDQSELLNTVESEYKAGTPFAELAQRYSVCPSARTGGELGWLGRGEYFPAFEAAVFQAGVGDVVRASTPRGHHLIAVLEEKCEAGVQQMSVNELQELLANPALAEECQFVDVREPGEYATAKLPLFKLWPLSTAATWAPTLEQDLDMARETIVLCHHGVRSMQMSQLLVSKGFTNVKNVTGGIHAYSMIDPGVPVY